jgi:uncharacterized protein (TIGR01777 family)
LISKLFVAGIKICSHVTKEERCAATPAPEHIHMNMGQRKDAAKRYALCGASGMLGKAIRAALASRGDTVIQLVRREPAQPGEVRWDPGSSSPIAQPGALEDLDAVIHLSGLSVAGKRWTPAYKQELISSRVGSTHSLATVLAGLASPPKALLVASAIGFYGDRGDEILDETSPAGNGFVPAMCQEWEAAARPAVDAGIRVVHLRFGVVLNAGEGALAQMVPPFRVGLGAKLGTGRQWMSWIGLPDTVAAVLFAIQNQSLAGPVNVTSPHPVTNADFTRILARQLKRPALFSVPARAARLVFGEAARELLLASIRVAPRKLENAGFHFTRPHLDEALADSIKAKQR